MPQKRNECCFYEIYTYFNSLLVSARRCYSNTCSVISGIGGASVLSSGKISDYPAGSGLVNFFDSEQQLRESLSEIVPFLTDKIALKKIEIDAVTTEHTKEFYGQRNIDYKFYDVYEFDGSNYRSFIQETVQTLTNEGLRLYDNSEVIGINRDPSTLCFCIKAKTPDGEQLFYTRNLVLATGALDIQDRLIEKMVGSATNCFEIGVRIEALSNAFGNTLSTHGDLKLKFGAGRTYCVTANGKIISYQTGGIHFLEGCMEPSVSTGYTNLAVLIKCDDDKAIRDFICQYREGFNGLPVKQKFVDYVKGQKVYKFLLLNPQEFAGKYMLTEAMDILFECISQDKAQGHDIKWNYSDYQLMEELDQLKEVWLKRKTLLLENVDSKAINEILIAESNEKQRILLKEYLESLTLAVPIKEKGKTGESNKLLLSDNFSYSIEENGAISIANRNMTFEIYERKLYKVVNIRYNPSQIVSRLMTGDLYQCLMILETLDISKYGSFLEYAKRITLEDELEAKIRAAKEFSRLSIGIHI